MTVARKSKYTIALLPGDGIGPEIVEQARRVLVAAAELAGVEFAFEEGLIGGAAIDATGTALPDDDVGDVQGRRRRAARRGGRPEVGQPVGEGAAGAGAARRFARRWACTPTCGPSRRIRRWSDASPLRPERLTGVDLLVVRELTGGIYFGEKGLEQLPGGGERARDLCTYDTEEVARIVRMAGELARGRRGKLTSVDKANVLETSRLWRRDRDQGAGRGVPRSSRSSTCSWTRARWCS